MKNVYLAVCKAVCPKDDEAIRFDVKIKPVTGVMLMAEQINIYLKRFERRKIFQEDLTRLIAKRFKARCKTRAFHLCGEIEIVSTWDGRK